MGKASQILDAARKLNWMIVTAESCTGGMIAARITDIPGSSDVFDRGFVTYSNVAKIKMLNIRPETLTSFGAVSEEIAAEMANGALQASDAKLAISVTGIAGPGSSENKPEGRVCFGLATVNETVTETVEFGAIGRTEVREATVEHALERMLTKLTS